MIGIGKNYPSPDEPEEKHINFFLMAKNALLPHKESLILSKRIGSLIPEGELAVVIGKTLKNASSEEAKEAIFGYTICNDFSARDTTPPESNAAIRKSSDGLLPMGPYLLLENSLRDFDIRTYCNEKLVQEGNTKSMLHKIPELISYISDFMTLHPFDVISTGTPGPKLKVERGSIIKVEIDGIGFLENKIV
ncbi:fumarylacetoacetate hydrolase family protein [Leptospira yasudae]|uniref:fumarylacetoacetate hydrolase family protein n=1 Tax=Leptospira yasudae TaxID=2202201 RepID=UPI00248CEB43|nr:fumarylacetoacetate hydrolase family protein [Leptospira yasudae]